MRKEVKIEIDGKMVDIDDFFRGTDKKYYSEPQNKNEKLFLYHAKLQEEIQNALDSCYWELEATSHLTEDEQTAECRGKIAALRGISDFADALLDEVSAEK